MAVMSQKCPAHHFTLYDENPERVASWRAGNPAIFEPGLETILKEVKNLDFCDEGGLAEVPRVDDGMHDGPGRDVGGGMAVKARRVAAHVPFCSLRSIMHSTIGSVALGTSNSSWISHGPMMVAGPDDKCLPKP